MVGALYIGGGGGGAGIANVGLCVNGSKNGWVFGLPNRKGSEFDFDGKFGVGFIA
jgi:hypothetical protein